METDEHRIAAVVAEQQAKAEAEKMAVASAYNRTVDLLTRDGLYTRVNVEKEPLVLQNLADEKSLGFDTFCSGCRKETTFRVSSRPFPSRGVAGLKNETQVTRPRLFGIVAVCQRCYGTINYVFQVIEDDLIKIGQMPSPADLSFSELRHIDAGIGDQDRKELGQALGLFAHDAAIGAYVYLRRTFERLIERAFVAKLGSAAECRALRMEDRIEALKGVLPDSVVKHSVIFQHLSQGIHSLSDDECKKYFPVMKAVLFQMLEQEAHQRAQAKAQKETDRAFQKILSGDASD